jgi:hypothetical protein
MPEEKIFQEILEAARTDEDGNLILNFQLELTFKGTPSHFTVDLEGMSLLTVTYHRDALTQGENTIMPDSGVGQMMERFEEHLCKKITGATMQLLMEAMAGEGKQLAAFFREIEKLSGADDAKKRIGVVRGKKPKLSKAKFNVVDERYDELHQIYKDWKKLHNKARQQPVYSKLTHKQWKARWSEIIQQSYEPDLQVDLLERLTDLDPYISSPSEIAYEYLSRETSYTVEYLKKIVRQARRNRTSVSTAKRQ